MTPSRFSGILQPVLLFSYIKNGGFIETLLRQEVVEFIERKTQFDSIRDQVYAITPEGCKYICAARKMMESAKRDIIYIFWKKHRKLQYKIIADSEKTEKFLHVNNIVVDKSNVTVRIDAGEGYKNSHLMKTYIIPLEELK